MVSDLDFGKGPAVKTLGEDHIVKSISEDRENHFYLILSHLIMLTNDLDMNSERSLIQKSMIDSDWILISRRRNVLHFIMTSSSD